MVTGKVNLAGREVGYERTVKKRGLRTLRLSVRAGGDVVVAAPRWMTAGAIERFIESKSHWLLGKIAFFSTRPRVSYPRTSIEYVRFKADALNLAKNRLAHFNASYGFVIGKISIRNQKSRWGSCSRTGNLNFNYKIAILPGRIADYIIVHELCHLGRFNHSRAFWDIVAKTIPDYALIRQELRRIAKA